MPKIITINDVKKYIENDSNSGCKLLSSIYENKDSPLFVLCRCGNVFETTFKKFKTSKKNYCKECMKKEISERFKLSNEEIQNTINSISKGESLIDISRKDDAIYITLRCTCGEIFSTRFQSYMRQNKRTCDKCSKKKLSQKKILSFEFVKSFIENESKSGCKLISTEYIGNDKLLQLKCSCGKEFSTTFTKFKDRNKRQCNQCSNKISLSHQPKSTIEFIEDVYNLVEDEFSVLGEYKSTHQKILMKHNVCGYQWQITPSSFLQKRSCPKCSKSIKTKDTKYFKQEVKELVNDEYEVLGEYKKSHQKILIKHNICGNSYNVKPASFLSGRRCPFCNESKGEQEIRHWLQNNNIDFESQYKFDNCRNIEPLPFDFAVFEDAEKTKLKFLIEYDGEFHYYPIISKKKLRYQQFNDSRKTNYCIDNCIPLLRISYLEFDNIKQVLEEKLKKKDLQLKQAN